MTRYRTRPRVTAQSIRDMPRFMRTLATTSSDLDAYHPLLQCAADTTDSCKFELSTASGAKDLMSDLQKPDAEAPYNRDPKRFGNYVEVRLGARCPAACHWLIVGARRRRHRRAWSCMPCSSSSPRWCCCCSAWPTAPAAAAPAASAATRTATRAEAPTTGRPSAPCAWRERACARSCSSRSAPRPLATCLACSRCGAAHDPAAPTRRAHTRVPRVTKQVPDAAAAVLKSPAGLASIARDSRSPLQAFLERSASGSLSQLLLDLNTTLARDADVVGVRNDVVRAAEMGLLGSRAAPRAGVRQLVALPSGLLLRADSPCRAVVAPVARRAACSTA